MFIKARFANTISLVTKFSFVYFIIRLKLRS